MKSKKTLVLAFALVFAVGAPLFGDELQDYIDGTVAFVAQMEKVYTSFRDDYNASVDDDQRLAALETFVSSMQDAMVLAMDLAAQEQALGDLVPQDPPPELEEAMARFEALGPEITPIFEDVATRAATDSRFAELMMQLQGAAE